MKQETNNEIDLLLRRLSRRDGSSVRDGETTEQHLDQHLDADELSSYAQHALPPAARARYTEHLAECATCRKLVTELSLSLGATVAAAAPVETVAESSGLKKFLASLFSPMVLRYAVPALGLIVVAVVGFVILRQPARNDFLAQVDTKQQQPAPASTTTEAPASSPNAAYADKVQTERSGQVAQPKSATRRNGIFAGDTAGTGPVAPAAPVREETADAVAPQPNATPEPPPAPKATAPAETEERKKKDAVAKKQSTPVVTVQSTEVEVSSKPANEPVRDFSSAKETQAGRADQSKREAAPVQGGATAGGVSGLQRGDRARTGKYDSDDTRTVAGRRFRKERGIWTDTAYDSSTKTVDMARGSEQFRALTADEPEIKKIAEQLDGEVIVVWKGRAYRIR